MKTFIASGEIVTFQQACYDVACRVADVVISKQKDYGKSNINAFGERGCLVRANDKMERLKHLSKENKDPTNESIDDSWLDLAGYSMIALLVRQRLFNLPLEDDG